MINRLFHLYRMWNTFDYKMVYIITKFIQVVLFCGIPIIFIPSLYWVNYIIIALTISGVIKVFLEYRRKFYITCSECGFKYLMIDDNYCQKCGSKINWRKCKHNNVEVDKIGLIYGDKYQRLKILYGGHCSYEK